MKFLKIIGCVFCSLMIFGGIIATITNPNVTSITMLIIFMGCDILLIKNLLKQENQNKKPVETSQVIAMDDMQNMNLIQMENQQRKHKFHKTKILKSVFSTICVIDENNKLFYFAFKEGKPTSQYYAFDEVKSYHFESIGEKYITKSKHGIGRAVVGSALFGATGAIVGASTSKKETKVVPETTVLKIVFSHPNGEYIETLCSPPLGLSDFLDKCISLNNKADVKSAVSEADEILKFKDLLDKGVITKEEFELKKQKLLGL